jgi:ABC-type transporter MlaC component
VVAAFALALAIASPSAVLARDVVEVELVRHGVADVLAAKNDNPAQRAQRAAALLERYVDLAAFEARVFADIDGSLNPAERKKLSDAFRALVVARISLRLPEAPAAAPQIDAPRTENGETRIRVVYGDDVQVDLVFTKPGAPLRIADATIAGASLSKNLRASVNKVMRKDGFDGLVARLVQLRERTTSGPHKSSDLTL